MVPALLELALEFQRAPLRFGHLSDPAQPLPDDFGNWLAESSVALAPGRIQTTAEALGTAPETLREAFRLLLRQVLLSPQADHYRVLGLSRHCSDESIKQHHSLLVWMFHPDRAPDDDGRGVSLTARINAAYQILRNPAARQRYDSRLRPTPDVARAGADAQAFFRPRNPLAVSSRPAHALPAPTAATRRLLLWTLACLALAAVAFSVSRGPQQPLLRINPELAERAPSGPSYLGGGQAERTAGPGQVQPGGEPITRAVSPTVPVARTATHADPAEPRSGLQPEPARTAGDTKTPKSAQPLPAPPRRPPQGPSRSESPTNASPKPENRAASIPARPQETPAKRESHRPTARAPRADAISALVGRLEGSFGRGDLAGVVGLFTANAVVNSGAGTAAIRSEYSELFSLAGQRRMTIWGLTWRKAENRRLSARGAIRIRTRSDPGAAWSTATGMVELEIVPWMGDYKISKMISHLSRQ